MDLAYFLNSTLIGHIYVRDDSTIRSHDFMRNNEGPRKFLALVTVHSVLHED